MSPEMLKLLREALEWLKEAQENHNRINMLSLIREAEDRIHACIREDQANEYLEAEGEQYAADRLKVKMQYEEFEAIIQENTPFPKNEENRIFLGLVVMRKYLPHCEIEAADYDIVYAADVKKLLEAGITPKDAQELNRLGWFIENGECLAHFV